MIILRQKECSAVDKKGNVVKSSIDALKEAHELGYTRKQAIQAAKRILKRAEDSANNNHDRTKKIVDDIVDKTVGRTRIGFKKDRIQSLFPGDHKFAIGFRPDQTEPTGHTVRLGFKKFSTTHNKLYREWKKTRDPETAYRWSQAWGEEVYEKTREEDLGNLKPDPKAMKAADDYVRSQDPKNYAKMKSLNKDLEDAYKGGNPTTIENARNAINTWTKKHSRKQKTYSKQDREVVPDDIAEEGKKSGVIQKDKNGDWRIISYKTKTNKSGKPEFWDAKYESKEAAEKALGGYFANKRR